MVFRYVDYCVADMDECSITNGGCEHNCTNTDGSRQCSCQMGFPLSLNPELHRFSWIRIEVHAIIHSMQACLICKLFIVSGRNNNIHGECPVSSNGGKKEMILMISLAIHDLQKFGGRAWPDFVLI